MRQIVLDTETTGLTTEEGHRIIEVGCLELINRRITGNKFHQYFNPEREVDPEALQVHGLSNDFLADKPKFKDLSQALLEFIDGAELIIHNAPFDIKFLDHEFRLIAAEFASITQRCQVIDTLVMARQKHPGQQNNLDALCRRYQVDNSDRDYHGALLDAKLLAEVYLAMTGGQTSFFGDKNAQENKNQTAAAPLTLQRSAPLPVIQASLEEEQAHQQRLDALNASSGGKCVWLIEENN